MTADKNLRILLASRPRSEPTLDREQIFDGEFAGHRNKQVLVKVIGE